MILDVLGLLPVFFYDGSKFELSETDEVQVGVHSMSIYVRVFVVVVVVAASYVHVFVVIVVVAASQANISYSMLINMHGWYE